MFWIVSIMIIVGGLTRLTDSGLSITEWELLKGIFIPNNKAEWNEYFDQYTMEWLHIVGKASTWKKRFSCR